MTIRESIQKILDEAVWAPSGENCQPWKFLVSGNEIKVFNLPEKDLSLYNFNQFGSYISHGAVIENIVIAAKEVGYNSDVSVFPNPQNPNHVSTIVLSKQEKIEKDPLFPYIEKRVSNRNPYEDRLINQDQESRLLSAAKEVEGTELKLISDEKKKTKLGKYLSVSDRLLFENRKLHDFLFSHIIWDEKESQEKKSGFYIKELALPPPIEKIFKLLRNWDKVEILNKFGFSKMAAKGNVKLYSKVSALGAVLSRSNTPKDYIFAGRAMQRVWLEATGLGLSIQPVTGIIFFIQRIITGDKESFSEEHSKMIADAFDGITKEFEIGGKNIAMLFRLGYTNKEAFKSLRLPPLVTFENN